MDKNSLVIEKHRILHGEYFNYWTTDGANSKFSCVNFNLLSAAKNLNQRSLDFKCGTRENSESRWPPIDMVYSTKHGPLAVCSKRPENKNVPIIELFPEIISGKENLPVVTINFKDDLANEKGTRDEFTNLFFTNSTEKELRFLRLDNDPDLTKDLIMWNTSGSTIFFDSLNNKLNFSNESRLTDVRVVKSRFLVVETADRTTGQKVDTFVFDMEADDRNETHVLAKYAGCNATKDNVTYWNDNWKTCTGHFHLSQMHYVNSHNLQENPSSFFFEFKKAGIQDANKPGRIDVYLCQRSTGTSCEIVIKSWTELATEKAARYTSNTYFLQITNSFDKRDIQIINSQNQTELLPNNSIVFEFFMSTKRYKAIPRSIFKIHIPSIEANKDNFFYYFDEVSEIVYITGRNFSRAFRIDPIKFKITFAEFNSSSVDTKDTFQTEVRDQLVPEIFDEFAKDFVKKENNWIRFVLNFGGRTVTHILTYNNRSTIGEYLFWPHFNGKVSVEGTSTEPTHVIKDSIPMGLSMSYDVSDLFRGSFIKLKTDSFNKTYQEVSNSYLDPYLFKLAVKKPKLIEDFYFVDVEQGEKRKVYIVVSTKTDTLIYTGNRYPFSANEGLTLSYTMRDFRSLSDFYPINTTHGLAQVQEVLYTLNPFNDNSQTETPSRGVNGVCHNSTLMFHDKLGPLHFCIHENKTFFKRLIDDSKIESLTMTKEVQDVMKTVNRIRFLRYSDSFINHIFVFYTLNLESIKSIKDTTFEPYTMFLAVLRIDHKADPSLVLVSKHLLPFAPKLDTNANLYALEIAGSRAIFLERSNVEKGEHRLGLLAIEKGQDPTILYYLPLPNKLLVEANTRFILTNVPDENDIDINQNSVMSIESQYYQICFKVTNADTKDIMVVVFNPQMPIFSSLSIIELPSEYKVVDTGPFFIVSKDHRRTSLALLAAKTAKIDDDYMSKENEMYVFMVTDMTPTLQFKPFKNTTFVIKPLNNSNVWQANNNQTYNFNVSSNILTEEKINENKIKNSGDKLLLDTIKKSFQAKYELWGNKFDAVENNTSAKNLEISIQIKSDDYINDLTSKEKELLEDLHSFFIRVDPLKHIIGHIFNYSGQAESSIEDFMGIVKVLSPNSTTLIKVDQENTNLLRNITEKKLGKITIDSSCPNPLYERTKTYTTDKETTLDLVRRCKPGQSHHFITTWEDKIWKVRGNHLMHSTTRFDKYEISLNYVLHERYVFYLQREVGKMGEAILTICRQDVSLLDRDVDQKDKINCTKDKSANITLKNNNVLKTTSLTMEITPLSMPNSNEADRYIITILYYNKPMSIFTLVEFYDMNFPASKEQSAYLNQLGSIYVGSNNLKVSVSVKTSNYTDKPADANTRAAHMYLALIYYRWRQATELTLMQDIVELNYTKNYATGELIDRSEAGKSSAKEVQGFTPGFRTEGLLMKFATLLYSMKDPSSIMRPVVEHVRIWTPQKVLRPYFEDKFDDNTVQIFKIIIDFPNSNTFLLHSNINFLKDIHYLNEKLNNTLTNKILGGIEISLGNYKIAPLENPFIGFMPNTENPDPVFIDDYYFIANNFQDKSYFYFYTLEPKKLKRYTDLNLESHRNIFGLNFSNKSSVSAATLYTSESETVNNYMRVNLLIPLEEKPVALTVMPNCNAGTHLEHCLFYFTTDESVTSVNFTSYVNLRVKTHKVASRNVSLNLTSKFGKTRKITVKMLGDASESFWKDAKHVTIIFILIGIAFVLTMGTMIIVKKDVQITLEDNNQILSRHSVVPITGLIMNFIENRVVPTEDNKDKEEYSVSSDDSDEEGEDLKKKLVTSKKDPVDPVTTSKPFEPIGFTQDTIVPRSGDNYIIDPEEHNSDEDYANPLK